MNTTLRKIAAVSALALGALEAAAIPTGNLGGLQSTLDSMTISPAGNSSVDVTTDFVADGKDAYWTVDASGGAISTIMIELAGFTQNTFGIYDKNDPSKRVELFNAANSVGTQALLSILADGSVLKNFSDTGVDFSANNFGFYLGVPDANSIWFSDTTLNADGDDHMAAYRGVGDTVAIPPYAAGVWGANEYALAWEDLPSANSDHNFTDMVVLVESVSPVPDGGATATLLGMGVLGLAGFARRKK